MKPPTRDRLIDLATYLNVGPTYQPDRRRNHRARTVINLALAILPWAGRLAATDYALRNGAPGDVVKRLLHDAPDANTKAA